MANIERNMADASSAETGTTDGSQAPLTETEGLERVKEELRAQERGESVPGVSPAARAASEATFGGKTGLETFKGQLVDIPDWVEGAERTTREASFRAVAAQYVVLSGVNPDVLTDDQRVELEDLRNTLRTGIINFKRDLEQERAGEEEGKGITVLEHVRVAALKFLKAVRLARPQERHGGLDREETIRRGRSRGYYEEVLFDDSPRLKELQLKYGGLPTYIFEGIVQEIDKEANRRPSPPLNPLMEEEYRLIKQRRERERPKEQKYTETPAYWGGRYYELLWPESSKDMIVSTLEWVKDRISEIGNRDPGTINRLLEDIRGKVVELLESCRVRLNGDEWFLAENKPITESDPNFLRARAFGEGVTDVIGNEKIMYKGSTENGPQYKERFASEFIAHHDEIYMAPKTAYIMHKLTKVKDGTYWLGHPWDVEKAEEGEIKDYRVEIEEEILEDAATHDIFLGDDMTRGLYVDGNGDPILGKDGRPIGAFEYREGGNPDKKDLRYSFEDNIETLLLDSDGQIRQRILATGDAKARSRHDLRVAFFRRTRERLDKREGLGFVTNQEIRALENQKRRPLTDKELAGLAELKRNILRAQLQQQGLTNDQIGEQIRSQMETQRQQKIRARIWQKMQQKTSSSFIVQMTRETMTKLADARASNDLTAYDQLLWQWVKDYNDYRIKFRLPRWYASGWDRVRLNIDRPEKVLDRHLSEEEFEAMFELVKQDQTLDEDRINRHQEEARFGFQLAKSYQIFHMQDVLLGGMRARLRDPKTGEYIGKLPGDDEETKEVNTRLGLTDANGSVIDPNRKIIRVFDVVQARLQIAIGKEEALINQAKADLAAAEQANNPDPQLISEQRGKLRDILVNSQFIATHALKEAGLVDGKMPVWSQNFVDRATIHAFAQILAGYGVERYIGGEITHDAKKEIYEMLERGRRGLKAEYARACQEFMVGTYPAWQRDPDGTISVLRDDQGNPIPDDQGNPQPIQAISLWTAASDWGEPVEVSEKLRELNKGAVKEDTMVTEAQFDISTSGGVAVPELIPAMGDMGYYPMLLWLGVTDIRELHGYIKRRDEVEYHKHKFFDVLDPVNNARAQAAAYNARKTLTGGEMVVSGEKHIGPGYLQEPFHGAFKSADWLQEQQALAQAYGMENTTKYLLIMQQGYRRADPLYLPYSQFLKTWQGQIPLTTKEGIVAKINVSGQDLERYRQLSYLDFDMMSKSMSDQFYQTMYGILDYFQWCLKANKELEANRAGRLYRNWEYDNTLKWYAFRRAMREAIAKGEKGFIIRMGYSPEVASEIAIRMMEIALQDADYVILRDYERDRLAMEGAQILSKVLTPDQREQGFVIPDEKDWQTQPEHIKLALENIGRRGLMEFMREEGYKTYYVDENDNMRFSEDKNGQIKIGGKTYRVDRNGGFIPLKEVLGRKIPPLVRQKIAEGDKTGKKLANIKFQNEF